MRGTVDRFEDNIAVIELDNGDYTDINLSNLPSDICVGDILEIEDNNFSINREETVQRKNNIHSLMDELFEDE